jgi:hypothetical protein
MYKPMFSRDIPMPDVVVLSQSEIIFEPLVFHARIPPWMRLREDGTWDLGRAWQDVHPERGPCDVSLDGTCSECVRVVAGLCDFPSFVTLPQRLDGCYPSSP